MVWYTGPILPPIAHGSMEFWLDEELLLAVQMDDTTFTPAEGMYFGYVPLEGAPTEYRVGDVKITFTEERTGDAPADPPQPAREGSIVLNPVIRVELQPPA